MRRRSFLTAGAGRAAAVVASVVSGGDVAVAAVRRQPVALWESLGGFVPAGYLPLRPASLAVYPDGLAIADAARYTRLGRDALDAFTAYAAQVLSDPANGVRRPG